MSSLSFSLSSYGEATIAFLLSILGISAVTSGLSGFGFSAIGAASLWILPPQVGVPLLMALSTANQTMSLRQLRTELKPIREWWPDGPAPFILGGILGIPIGLHILHALPTSGLMVAFGTFLVVYALYSTFDSPTHRQPIAGWRVPVFIGVLGGIIGGFTAFPGAAVVLWIGRQRLPKQESRAIVQPYIFAMQLVALAMLAIHRPSTFDAQFWSLFAAAVVVVLPGTFLGVRIYRSLSDINFRRVCFALLGMSGLAILCKGVVSSGIVEVVSRLLIGRGL
jgi:uncharacterized membrane protein YfcA